MDKKTLLGALNAVLRLKDESMKQFAEQMRALTPQDRLWLADRIRQEGMYEITDYEAIVKAAE